MIRSLRTGVTGLRSHQARMDVIGNNIANVNTTAFKRSRVAFAELLGQQMLGVGRMAGGNGINPATIGMGVGVSSIDQNWAQGNNEFTNLGTDLAINGDGFFVVKGGADDAQMLSRAGDFGFNARGELVTSSGMQVQGWRYEDDGTLVTGALQDVVLDAELTDAPIKSTEIDLKGNLSVSTDASKPVSISTVVYDSLGQAHKLVMEFTKGTNPNEWTMSKANLLNESAELEADQTIPILPTPAPSITFDGNGKIASGGTITLAGATFPNTAGEAITLDVNLGEMTQVGGSTTAVVGGQDGRAPGQLTGYSFNTQGEMLLSFSNGNQKPLFQLALADVPNPNGLEQRGENLYSATAAAGDLVVGRPGQEINASVVAGALEMSNVDLANEFTDMIVTQRGYQASARVITTSDELLQEVVQLKR